MLSACYQVSLITSRLELALKVNAVKHTGYSKASVTVDTSKYQCGLSLFCQMTHPCPVSRYYQANDIKWVWHSWIERIAATIFSWCFCRLNNISGLFYLLFNPYAGNESILNVKVIQTLFLPPSSPPTKPPLRTSA